MDIHTKEICQYQNQLGSPWINPYWPGICSDQDQCYHKLQGPNQILYWKNLLFWACFEPIITQISWLRSGSHTYFSESAKGCNDVIEWLIGCLAFVKGCWLVLSKMSFSRKPWVCSSTYECKTTDWPFKNIITAFDTFKKMTCVDKFNKIFAQRQQYIHQTPTYGNLEWLTSISSATRSLKVKTLISFITEEKIIYASHSARKMFETSYIYWRLNSSKINWKKLTRHIKLSMQSMHCLFPATCIMRHQRHT